MYYFNNNDNSSSEHHSQHNHDGPLFSQPLDPSTLSGPLADYDNIITDPLFDSNHNWDFYSQQQLDPQQEAILLNDPNFLRQHQLLHDQQKELHSRLLHDDERPEQVSNLTAMFEPIVVKIEQEEDQDKKSKRINHRRQQVVMKTTINDDDKVDHQRRFNELQARFRVNYARKPSVQQTSNNMKPASSKTPKQSLLPQQQALQDKPSLSLEPTTTPATVNAANHTTTTASATTAANAAVSVSSQVMTDEELSSSFPSRTMPIQIQRVPRLNSLQPFDAESHQKQLDNQLDKVDFDDITVSELKEMLRQRGKPATGKKAVLLQRLQEERDLSKGGRSAGSYGSTGSGGRLLSNRHSQPVPFSRSINIDTPQRPRSFQSSSPVMIHNPDNSSPIHTISPSSPGASLHRSIANMHIGSPPAISRRYSPYSPRLSSSPKPVHHEYSSSVPLTMGESPNNNTLTTPNNTTNNNNNINSNNYNNNNMMLSSSYSVRSSCRYYNNPKTYKPFMSSALATPDREEDVNPFDSFYARGSGDAPIKEEDTSEFSNYYGDAGTRPVHEGEMHSFGPGEPVEGNMDWIDPTAFENILQQQVSHDQLLSNDQIMAMINTQQQAFDFRLDDSNFSHPYYHQ
ncbi:uncharacterized protein EV154DRAFT_520813 [Mucor mucedo]|uniref:uncharacterized protein n=1 Tax=Mucor mucedo TaxID=29922 RepID=UPI00221F10C9|nr:uncharacterized protein EV154DRAFT_520813 [Mucor mucedo]KAI7887286.1 hypothetical protein EV154DRAFT_520813 [Mucor mucedo]